jgi:hypothetical protein
VLFAVFFGVPMEDIKSYEEKKVKGEEYRSLLWLFFF